MKPDQAKKIETLKATSIEVAFFMFVINTKNVKRIFPSFLLVYLQIYSPT